MTRIVLASLIALGGAACMHAGRPAPSATAQPETAAPPAATTAQAGMCPMNVPGTRVSAEDTPDGEALAFTTTPDQAPALQQRVHAMVEMHNRHHGGGMGPGGPHGMHGGAMEGGHAGPGAAGGTSGGTMGGQMGEMQMPPPSRAAVEDLPDGARIVVTPNDPADLERLRKTVRMHAEHMQQHGCAMMDLPQG